MNAVPSGKSVCRFSIASNRYYRNSEKELVSEVNYINVDTWGALAESCGKYLSKGRGVRVVGRLKQDRWQDEQEQMHERFVVVAEHVEFHPDVNKNDTTQAEIETDGNDMVFEQPKEPKKKRT